jgi:hypothetical protein
MNRVLHSAIAGTLIATMAVPASAQIGVRASTSASDPSEESVVVLGQRRQIAQALRKLIQQTDSEQLARFEDEVCPMVIGMPRDWTASLTRIIRDNIQAVGGKVGKPGCKVNAPVIFIDQPLELIKALAEEEPGFFNMTPRELAYFTATPRPVTSWHVTDMRGRDGEELGSVRSIVDPGSGAHLSVDSSAKVTRSFTVGRLASPVREDMLVGFVVIDRMATPGKSLRQIADLATMHMLLDINQQAGVRDPGSILSLFEARAAGVPAPARLSQFDRGALRGFYTQRENNRTARQQAENIAKAIEKGAGEEPARPQP